MNNLKKLYVLVEDKKVLVSELTHDDKYKLASGYIKREFLTNVSHLVSEVTELSNNYDCELASELLEIAYTYETLDAQRECQLSGWEKVTDIASDRLFEFCAGEGIESLLDIDGGYGIDKLYINTGGVFTTAYYIDSWEELAENEQVDLECEPMETLEYWAVSEWFASKLDNTIEVLGLSIWGRTCSGQAIAADGDIQELCIELASFEAV